MGVGIGCSGFHGYERSVGAALYVALPWLVFVETVSHNGFSGRCGQHVVAQADDASRGDMEFEMYAVVLLAIDTSSPLRRVTMSIIFDEYSSGTLM